MLRNNSTTQRLTTAIVSSSSGNNSLTGDGSINPSVLLPFDLSNFDYSLFMEDLSNVHQPWSDDTAFLPTIVVYSLAFFFGFLGNLFVVFALLSDRKSDSLTTSFLVSLAVADVVFLLVCLPYEVVFKLGSVWRGGLALCKLAGFVEMLTAVASVLNLTCVSIERYIVIVHPLKSRTWCSTGRTHRVIAMVWVASVILASPLLHIMDTNSGLFYNNDSYVIIETCVDSNVNDNSERIAFAWYQLTVVFLLPVATIIFCYAFVIKVLWLSTKQLAAMMHTESPCSHVAEASSVHRLVPQSEDHQQRQLSTSTSSRLGRRHSSTAAVNTRGRIKPYNERNAEIGEARKQVIRMLLTIITVFFVCWGPKWVLNVLKRHELDVLHTDAAFYVMLVIHLLPYVQSSINPIIYSFMSHNFRRTARTLWRRSRARCRRCLHGATAGAAAGNGSIDDWRFVELVMDTRSMRTGSVAISHAETTRTALYAN